MKLRDNQVEPVYTGVEFLRMKGIQPAIIVAPTAFGKSIVIAFIAKELNEKIIVLQPSKELLEQNYNKFISLGGKASIYSASMNEKEIGDVTYATIGSIIGLASKFKELGVTKIIIDECDRYPRARNGQLRRFIDASKIKNILGLTATPLKLQSLMGEFGPYSKLVMLTNRNKHGTFFKHIIHVTQIKEIVDDGFWTPLLYESYDFDTGELVYTSNGSDFTQKSMVKAYENQDIETKIIKKIEEVSDRKSILVAVPTIEQATALAGKIPNAAVVHGETPKAERDRIITQFKNRQLRVVVQVNVLTVGFDYPELDCIITARPTASISWWYQFVGRGTRIHPDKKDCLVVDFVGSLQRFGKVEELYYKEIDGKWEMYGEGGRQLSGIPMHEIGIHLEGGIDLSKKYDDNGDEEQVYMTFGKYKNKPLKNIPPSYREWLLENIEWKEWNMKIKDEIIRLREIQRR